MPISVIIAAATAGAAVAVAGAITGAFAWAAVISAAAAAAVSTGVAYLLSKREGISMQFPIGQGGVQDEIVSAVAPARYVFGKVRMAGYLVFAEVRPDSDGEWLDMAFALSDGDIDGIEKVYDGDTVIVDGGGVISDSGRRITYNGNANSRILDNFMVHLYRRPSSAGDDNGITLRDVNPKWTKEHRLSGISWVHVAVRQEKVTEREARVFQRRPRLTFLVRGKVLDTPIYSSKTYTNIAADVRYWYETVINGRSVDLEAYRAAWTVCTNHIALVDAEGNEVARPRYTVNGVITSVDNRDTVAYELDQAWQGSIVFVGGHAVFRPGALRSPITHITNEDIIEVRHIQPAPALQDRLNSVSVALAQCDSEEWTQFHVPAIVDHDLVERDGVVRHADLGIRAFITNAVAAARLATVALRRARQSAEYVYRVFPRSDLSLLEIFPSDIVTITETQAGLLSERCMVVQTEILSDWSIVLTLVPEPAEVWGEHALEPKPARAVTPTLTITGARTIILSWTEPTNDDTIFSWEYQKQIDSGPFEPWEPVAGGGNVREFTAQGLFPGRLYGFRIRAINSFGPGNPSGIASGTPNYGAPEAPIGLVTRPDDQSVWLTWEMPTDPTAASITNYQFRWARVNAGTQGRWTTWADIPSSGPDTIEYKVTGLTNNVTYRFRIRAVGTGGIGPRSDTVEAAAGPVSPPAPMGVSATPGDRFFTVNWAGILDPTITDWQMQVWPVAGSPGGILWLAGLDHTSTSYTTGASLTNGQAYKVRIRAVNAGGEGVWSDTITVKLPGPATFWDTGVNPWNETAVKDGAYTGDFAVHLASGSMYYLAGDTYSDWATRVGPPAYTSTWGDSEWLEIFSSGLTRITSGAPTASTQGARCINITTGQYWIKAGPLWISQGYILGFDILTNSFIYI